MKAFGAVVAIALALALQTMLDRFVVRSASVVDLVLVAVVYVALTSGPVAGLFAGSVAGLIQDSLTAPIVGVGGLAKAVVGFFAGAFAQQFIVNAALPRLLIFVVATVVHAAVLLALYAVLQSGTLAASWTVIAKQALGNALVGAVAFAFIEAVPGVMERRRIARRSRH